MSLIDRLRAVQNSGQEEEAFQKCFPEWEKTRGGRYLSPYDSLWEGWRARTELSNSAEAIKDGREIPTASEPANLHLKVRSVALWVKTLSDDHVAPGVQREAFETLMLAADALAAKGAGAAIPEPITTTRLLDLLVWSELIDEDARDRPEGYDNYATVSKVEALAARLCEVASRDRTAQGPQSSTKATVQDEWSAFDEYWQSRGTILLANQPTYTPEVVFKIAKHAAEDAWMVRALPLSEPALRVDALTDIDRAFASAYPDLVKQNERVRRNAFRRGWVAALTPRGPPEEREPK